MKKRIEKPRHRPYDRIDHKHSTALLVHEDRAQEAGQQPAANDRAGLAGGLFVVSVAEWTQWRLAHGGGVS